MYGTIDPPSLALTPYKYRHVLTAHHYLLQGYNPRVTGQTRTTAHRTIPAYLKCVRRVCKVLCYPSINLRCAIIPVPKSPAVSRMCQFLLINKARCGRAVGG